VGKRKRFHEEQQWGNEEQGFSDKEDFSKNNTG